MERQMERQRDSQRQRQREKIHAEETGRSRRVVSHDSDRTRKILLLGCVNLASR